MSIDNRRIRFATIDGLGREDLPLAAEIWREDLRCQVWASREIQKLATLFVRYMADARPENALISHMERSCQIDRMQIQQCLQQMRVYGAVEAFALDGDVLKAALNLSILQRLRVLRCRKELDALISERAVASNRFPLRDTPEWLPANGDAATEDEALIEAIAS